MKYVIPILALLIALPALAIDFEGTEFSVGWTASTGAVEGYQVHVGRNGGAFQEESTVTEPTAVLGGLVGETLIVKVRAYSGDYLSEFSPESDPIRLVTNAPGEITIGCVDPSEVLEQTGPNRFRCVIAPVQ